MMDEILSRLLGTSSVTCFGVRRFFLGTVRSMSSSSSLISKISGVGSLAGRADALLDCASFRDTLRREANRGGSGALREARSSDVCCWGRLLVGAGVGVVTAVTAGPSLVWGSSATRPVRPSSHHRLARVADRETW